VTQVINETTASVSLEGIAAGVRAVDAVFKAQLAEVFAQRRSVEVAFGYMDALSPQVRGNCWALAEAAGHCGWWRMQALLNRYVWDFTAARALLAPLAARWLTCPGDDLAGPGIAVDETAVLKKGDHTFAVAPQHAGCTGKVENCVTTVFCAYVTTAGSCWVDFDVYMPQRWADDPARRDRAGVPQDLKFATKPELADAQIRRLVATGIGIDWTAGDEVYGRSASLRATCTELHLTSVFIVPVSFQFTTPAGSVMTAAQAGALADAQDAFERRPCGNGSKGPRLFDWALVATADPHEFLLIRRLISRPDQLTFLICHVPDLARARLPYLVTIAGRRWPVEESFKVGKDVLDYDQSQVRTYTAINRHTVLTALAQLRQVAALARLTNPATPTGGGPATPPPTAQLTPLNLPALAIPLGDSPVPTHAAQPRPADLGHIKLSVAEHHRLLQLARAKAAGLLSRAAEIFHLRWSSLRRRHQATARWHHYLHRLHQALDPG
jgi:DDE superfamily endonuclease